MEKICLKLKWLSLPVALLIFGLFGLGIGQVKAEISVVASTTVVAISGNDAKITTIGCDGSAGVMLLIWDWYYFGGGISGATIDGDSMTNLNTTDRNSVYYLTNYSIGTDLSFTVSPGDFDYSNGLFLELCGVDTADPFEKVNSAEYPGWDNPYTYYATSTQDVFTALSITNQNQTISDISFTPDGLKYYNTNKSGNYQSISVSNLFTSEDADEDISHYWRTAGAQDIFVDIIFNTAESTSDNIVYWAGVGSQYGEWYKTMKIPVYWNVCEDYDNINRATIELNEGEGLGETEIIQDKSVFIGPQKCSGISYIEIDGNTVRNWWQAGTTTSTIAMDLFKADSTDTIISSEFNLLISNGINASNFIDSSIVSPLVIASTTGTTTIPFTYNVTGLNVDEICAYNTKTNTILDICQTITEDSGITSMNWPNSAAYQSLYLKYVGLDSNDNIKIMSDQFNIIFNGITDNPYLNPDASSSIFSFFNKQPSEVACSDAMWEKASTSDAFFNFTELYCDAMTGMITTIDTMGSFIVKGIQEIGTTLSHLFPINVAVKIKSSWDNSASSTLPTDLAWINEDIDENGNIYLNNIEGEGMATGTQIILGSNIMGDNEFPNKIKSLSKYIMIGIFFEFSVILRGKKVYESLKQEI